MVLDFQRLDDILYFLKISQGYKGSSSYKTYNMESNSKLDYRLVNLSSYSGWGFSLLYYGLVGHKSSLNDGDLFIINPKGIELISNNQSTRIVHEEFKKREKLEVKILEGTVESYRVAKSATYLNKIQLWITLLLGLTTLGSIYFQFQANKIAEETLNHAMTNHQLELKNKKIIDTIFVKMNRDFIYQSKKQDLKNVIK